MSSEGFVASMLGKAWTRLVLYYLLVAPMLLGPAEILWQRSEIERARETFVEVEATVVRSEMELNDDDRSVPRIDVTYEYEGQRYWLSMLVTRGIEGAGELEDEELVERYGVGTTLPVWINPEDPEDGTLSLSYDAAPMIFAALPLLAVTGVRARESSAIRCCGWSRVGCGCCWGSWSSPELRLVK